jgi:hypothetical protein
MGVDLSKERWRSRLLDPARLAAPGQIWPDSRYTERFAAVRAALKAGFRVTTDGHVVPDLYHLEPTGVSTEPIRRAAERFLESHGCCATARARRHDRPPASALQ